MNASAAPTSLVFVYNADGGLLAGARDVAHKVLRPSTYPCRLCDLTYGVAGKKRRWRDYVDRLPMPVRFVHRDELRRDHPDLKAIPLPAVLAESADGRLDVIITADELRATESLDGLEALVDRVLGSS